MMKKIFNKKGETYIDVAITVMLVAFVLLFAVNMVSMVALNQNMMTIADQLVDYASVNGTTDVIDFANDLRRKTGINFSYSFSGSVTLNSTEKVQLGEKIICTVSYRLNMMGFGDRAHSVEINASSSGLSQVYWK